MFTEAPQVAWQIYLYSVSVQTLLGMLKVTVATADLILPASSSKAEANSGTYTTPVMCPQKKRVIR